MKAEVHKKITTLVLDKFAAELGFTERECKWIIRGTGIEDWLPVIDRITNWHFYRSENSSIPKHLGICRPTSEKRVKKLSKRFKWLIGKKKKLTTLGRIIHHVQDMSTPSYVVPIYHGPGSRDPYETYMMKHMMEQIEKGMDFLFNISRAKEFDSFMNVYDAYAKDTLEYLANTKVPLINQDSSVLYKKLWMPYPDAKGKYTGFGKFGEFVNCFDGKILSDGTHIDITAIYKHFIVQVAQSTYDTLVYYKKLQGQD